jgi:RNA polymerase sigma-70 factor (ECF subfamily)
MLRRLRDAELAHDATQEVFFQVTRSYDRFDPERGTFEGWVLGFVDHVARRARERQSGLPRPQENLPERPADDERPAHLSPELRNAINGLPLRDRTLLFLRGVEGWPAISVAEHLGMTPTNVNTAFARVCARLAKRLELPDVA